MKDGFAHFDNSHRENFIAAVLLFAMEADDAVRDFVGTVVRRELAIGAEHALLAFGREARLAAKDDDDYARVDLWLLFGSQSDPFYAFVEVKTHHNWDARHVARQVRDQAERKTARSTRRVHGSMLLAPERLCYLVQQEDAGVRVLTWAQLIAGLRALSSPSIVTTFAIRHLEQHMDRAAGLDRALSLTEFERATTTIACLRQFVIDCIRELRGSVHGDPVRLTPADGQPLRGGGWAWHGLSVPFTLDGAKGRIGIYKYAEAPPGEQGALATLWLEAYFGDGDGPIAAIPFAPTTLAAQELDRLRTELARAWDAAKARSSAPNQQPAD